LAKVTLTDIVSGYSAAERLNANFEAIEAALENTLSRDGTTPNQMEAHLDMNGKRILNIASPASPLDPARLIDITGLIELTGAEVPAMTGNENKVLQTDGSILFFGDVSPDALPEFTDADRGAVPASGTTTAILRGDGWQEPEDLGLVVDDSTYTPAGALNRKSVTLAYDASCEIDTSLGNIFFNTLTGNVTYDFTNEVDGREFWLFVEQDSTGGRGATWPDVTWANGQGGSLADGAGEVTAFKFVYNGTDWYGVAIPLVTISDTDSYDLVFSSNENNIDVFRRLGSPDTASTWNILLSDGVVIHSSGTGVPALDFSGAFPTGTILNFVNRGFVLGRGGRGGNSPVSMDADSAEPLSFGRSLAGKAGGNAIKGPPTGVTLNITNASGYIWGGGGGGGCGGCSVGADHDVAVGGAGGGGGGLGAGGQGAHGDMDSSSASTSADAADGILGLDGSAAGGAGGAGNTGGGGSAASGGAGGTYGAAGTAGSAATAGNAQVSPGSGGAAGKAVDPGAGTVTFISGSSSPNVKGAIV
jgi:hypothetical protein